MLAFLHRCSVLCETRDRSPRSPTLPPLTPLTPSHSPCFRCLDPHSSDGYRLGTPPSIELLDYSKYVKHSGYHFWYSSTRWSKITSKPHLFVTFWTWRKLYPYNNVRLQIMYNVNKFHQWYFYRINHFDIIWFYIFCFNVCKTEYSIPSQVMRFEASR